MALELVKNSGIVKTLHTYSFCENKKKERKDILQLAFLSRHRLFFGSSTTAKIYIQTISYWSLLA